MSHDYEPIPVVFEDSSAPERPHPMRRAFFESIRHPPRATVSWTVTLLLISIIPTLLSGLICFSWGRSTERQYPGGHSDWLSPPGDVHVVFKYQRQFAVASADGSREPWYSLFPRKWYALCFVQGHLLILFRCDQGAVASYSILR